jgi:hypothetical protein
MTIHKPSSWRPALLAPLAFGACELAEVEIEPVPDLVVAAVSVVMTIDPLDPSRVDTRAFALVAVSEQVTPREIPGASVTVVGESGRSLRLREVSDPVVTCVTQLEIEGRTRPPAGSCHVAAVPGAYFAPGERLMLTVELPDGGILRGESRMPGVFTPTGLSLRNGRCRLDPDTVYRFDWAHSAGSRAYIAEARLVGLGDLWPHQELFLDATLRRDDEPRLAFPRDLLFNVFDQWKLTRVLHQGLPEGTSAEIAVGAVDRNWANWIRAGRIDLEGEVRIPSVFGDGTGMFGTAVRWKLEIESRAAHPQAGDDDLPLCGPPLED